MDRISQQIEEASQRAKLAAAAAGQSATPIRPQSVESVGPMVLPEGRPLELDFAALEDNFVVNGGHSPFAEVYRVLRTRVLQQMRQNDWCTLGITSANAKAGKTTTSINLSLAIARDPNFQSILLDCDFRRSNVHKSLMFEPEQGLIDYLQGDAELTEIMCSGRGKDWRVMPSGSSEIEAPSELFSSDRMRELFNLIRQEREKTIAVVDLPPASVGDDVLTLSAGLDAILFVVEDGVTDDRELRKALDIVKGNNIIGVVLNKSAEASDMTYGYYN